MIPPTKNGLSAADCISAMQKSIRRGLEREAMEFAVELLSTSKAFHSWVCRRLEIISHEDIDTQQRPDIVPFVRVAIAQAREWYDPDKLGNSRMAVGNVIRLLARAPKSREGDHFQAAIGLRSELEGYTPVVPDHALDRHTQQGKRMGRGIKHFREQGAMLVPAPTAPDDYESEAFRLWELKEQQGKRKADLFDE